MTIKVKDVRMEIIPDGDPDPSYLEQEGFEDRLAAYQSGEFSFVGVRAVAEILLSSGILQSIESPGLWGVEDDSGDDYFRSVFEEELSTLRSMLNELNVPPEELSSLNPALIP